jgi:hypothetical protein
MTITAKMIADSINPQGKRICTIQLRYPRFIHAEFMTHRVFSRNASSSRAIPVEKLIQDIINDTAMPLHWGKNQPGMQAKEECDELVWLPNETDPDRALDWATGRDLAWIWGRDQAIILARAYAAAGYHKQIVNRILEPFSHINVLVTSTEWDNFFELRDHPDAQPEIMVLAQAMKKTMVESKPILLNEKEWHIPYVEWEAGLLLGWETAIKLSVARCARVSYLTQDGKVPSIEADLALYDRLVGSKPLHASPAEHQARPNMDIWGEELLLEGNFQGWVQYRKILEQGFRV